ncbi:hypothetical protein [Actinomadura sp. GTD37]|uniref:hypothetical protein n=1 Tax=Actinomadura sp. GTD37 TaxID=1778030 RepID=UPI0035C05F42
MSSYRVTAPCLVHVPVRTATGPALGTVYAGDVLPGGVPEEKIRFWLDGGMIEEIEAADEPESGGPEVAKGQGPEPGQAPGRQPGVEVDPDPDVPAPSVTAGITPPPTGGAGSGKEAWVDYAVARGFTREDAEGMTRDDLIKALKPAE